jgi:hypothetical protein
MNLIQQPSTINFLSGSIIKVDFDSCINSEINGLHYAVVMNTSNNDNSSITVIPLRPLQPQEDPTLLHVNEVYLGDKLFMLLNDRLSTTTKEINARIKEERNLLGSECFILPKDTLNESLGTIKKLESKRSVNKQMVDEINAFKQGCVATINQITDIKITSIVAPKDEFDVEYGVTLSPSAMQLIKSNYNLLTNI